jgi:trigger factor
MTVEVAEERVEKALRQKARELAREIRVPGFRPGKAPYHVILRRVGKESLRAEVINKMMPDLFEEALAQTELSQEDLYTSPSLDELSDEPLTLRFTLPLQPVVTLGDYRALRHEIEPVEVTETAVDEALESIRSRHATIEKVERPAELGDLVTIGGVGRLLPQAVAQTDSETEEGEESETAPAASEILFDNEQINILLDKEKSFSGTPFVDNMVGLSAGDETTFIFTFPDDYSDQELAGREAQFEVTMRTVQRYNLPPLDADLAQKEGSETVAELREKLRQRLQTEAEQSAKNELLTYMIETVQQEATLTYPPAAITAEIDQMLKEYQQQVTRSGWQWQDFLTIQGMTEDDVRDNFRDAAVQRIETRLIAAELVAQEKLSLEMEEVDSAIEVQLASFEDERVRDNMREYLRQSEGLTSTMNDILSDKLYQRIKAILSGTAPDLSQLQVIPIEDEEE